MAAAAVPAARQVRFLWLAALAWMIAIYSTLYIARPIAEALRQRNLLRLTVGTIIALLGVAVLVWAVRARLGWRAWSVVAAGSAALLLGMAYVSPVEVKLHFVEYCVLGCLLYLALSLGGSRLAALRAIVLTGLAGWLDEGIQYMLPNRWYDIADVAINATAGVIGVLTLVALGWVRRAR